MILILFLIFCVESSCFPLLVGSIHLIWWLQDHVVLRLKKLELSSQIAHYFLRHQRMEVEELSLVGSYIYVKSISFMSLKCLKTPDEVLSSKCLKRFRLSFRDPLTSGIVLNLAHGLLKQAEVGYLEELDLSGITFAKASHQSWKLKSSSFSRQSSLFPK